MNEFVFENQENHTYIVYEIGAEDIIDEVNLGMLTNNTITGLAPVLFTQMNASKYVKYNISHKIPLSQFFDSVIKRVQLVGVLRSIVNGLMAAEDYMIDIGSIVLDMEYIFVDVSTYDSYLLCLPVCRPNVKVNMQSFFKEIMFAINFDTSESGDYITKIINFINSSPNFVLSDFRKLLEMILDESRGNVVSQQTTDSKNQKVHNNQSEAKQQPENDVSVTVLEQKPNGPIIPSNLKSINKKQKENISNINPSQGQKKMSWFYLMAHYNKENAKIYKAQKQAEKTDKSILTPPQMIVGLGKRKTPNNLDFDIPGQNNNSIDIQKNTQVSNPVPPNLHVVPQKDNTQPNGTQQANGLQPLPDNGGTVADFGNTTNLNQTNIGETTSLLSHQMTPVGDTPYLMRIKTKEIISINKPTFRVGKEKSYVDYFIGDNSAISRSHANFITRDGSYFVLDTNSTNHTFVNGKMIPTSVEVPINPGDTIRLANDEFVFKIH